MYWFNTNVIFQTCETLQFNLNIIFILAIIEFDEDRGDEKYIYILKGDSKQLECGNKTQERIFWYKVEFCSYL